ncbi:MAG TPA: extracellular solute-binding protein, partial [Caldilineaceae bacterium]|nr:extracellular solute-binding protein [Caldilineaceae bacterium]
MSNPKHLSRRDFLRAASFSAVGVALAACAAPGAAPAQTGESGEAAPPGEKITIRFHARIGQQEDTLYDMQMPKFMEEYPNIELVKESFPGEEFSTKISTMLAGGTLGDVIWSALGQAKIQFAWAQGQIAPIDDLVEAQSVDLSEWYQGCLDAITVEGNLLGLPFKAHPGLAIVYYNQTAIEEAGLEPPANDWTQEQQIELAKALTKSEGDRTTQFGYLPSTTWKAFVTLTRAFGGELISEDGTQFLLMEDAGRQSVNYLYDLFHTHQVAPKPDQMVGAGNDMWISGVLGLYQGGTSVSVTGSAIGDKFEWMVVPNAIGPGGVGGSDFEVDAYCVTTTTQHPDEAFLWVRYLCNRDSGVQLGLIGGTVGGRPDVYGAEELLQFPFRVVFKEVMDNAMASRITANWRQEEAENAFAQLTQPLWAGEEEPTEA